MAYKQYTSCTKAEDHVKMNQYIQATIQGLLAAGIAAALAAAVGEPWCLLVAAEIGAMMWLVAYCHWWLEDRLVCLDGDQTVIGMLVSTEPPGEKSFPDSLDTDFSVNLLVPPNPPGVDQATAAASSPYGNLMKEQDSTKNAGLVFTGETATDKGTGIKSAIMHGEFEGGGVADALLGAQIGLALSVAALIACLAAGPWGAALAALLALLALLAALFGVGAGLGDTGSPGDVNPSLSDLHTNDHATGLGADILLIQGRWVYDAGHNNEGRGWNEIHPIKYAQKVGTWDGDWVPDIAVLLPIWEAIVNDATSPTTVGHQKDPKHQWHVHPVIDGCQSDDDDNGDDVIK